MAKIRQEVTVAAPPAKVYRALVDSAQHSQFTGAPAEIGARVGDAWSAYGGMISGRQIELIDGARRGTLDDLATLTVATDKVLVF